MANLLAGREVVPERLVSRRGGGRLADDLLGILRDGDAWERARAGLGEVRERIARPGVADRVAGLVLAQAPRRAT
jgi:hypothetical protein